MGMQYVSFLTMLRMTRHPASSAVVLALLVGGSALLAQSGPTYPAARKGTVVDDYFGTKIPDPYRWMEDLNAPEVKAWVNAQNAVTFKYLDALPARERLRSRITELWNYARVSAPYYRGGHWFYSRNTGLQRQSVIYTRASLTSAESIAIDPNSLSPDGSVALADFVASPDGKRFAYALSEGGSDWSTY